MIKIITLIAMGTLLTTPIDARSSTAHGTVRSIFSCKMAPNTMLYKRKKTLDAKAAFIIKQMMQCPAKYMGSFIKTMKSEFEKEPFLFAIIQPFFMIDENGYKEHFEGMEVDVSKIKSSFEKETDAFKSNFDAPSPANSIFDRQKLNIDASSPENYIFEKHKADFDDAHRLFGNSFPNH
jgi:hypothetical protein